MTQEKWKPNMDSLADAAHVLPRPVDDLLWALEQTIEGLQAELSRDTDGESGSDIIQSQDVCMQLTIERLEQIKTTLQAGGVIDHDDRFWHNKMAGHQRPQDDE